MIHCRGDKYETEASLRILEHVRSRYDAEASEGPFEIYRLR